MMNNRDESIKFNLAMIDYDTKRCNLLRFMAERITVSTPEVAKFMGISAKAAYSHLNALMNQPEFCVITKVKSERVYRAYEFTLELIKMDYREFRSLKIELSHSARPYKEAKRKREKKAKEEMVIPSALSGIIMGNISYSSRANGFRQGCKYVR